MTGETGVLIIDSHRSELRRLSTSLHKAGFQTIEAENCARGLSHFLNARPGIVVIDLGPGESAWPSVSRIRRLSDVPILVIASEATNESISRAFDLDVDGFLTRPFDPRDLVARIHAIQSHSAQQKKDWVYERDGLKVDFRSCEVFVDGRPVALTGTEFRLLTYLIERRGWVVSHDQILNNVWGSDYLGEKDQVKLYIWYLRRKIEADPKQPRNILTRRGLGYTFVA